MEKAKKPTEKQRLVLRELVEFKCRGCNKHEDNVGKLEPHRIIRGYQGGKYFPNNILMLCSKCHKIRHFKEWKKTGV